ncbi:hypothetical protein C2E23DRAFT_718514 [Lenzites betulinus]|nr:hypothetical protein C2E23DRAFT_718514 [Lenzites betulinus]
MDAVTKYRNKYEDEGFIRSKNRSLTRALIGDALARKAHTAFVWVKGHKGHPGNEAADKLAAAGASRVSSDDVSLAFPPTYQLTGAKLSTITQSLAYRVAREKKTKQVHPRLSTVRRMEQIIADLTDDFGVHVTPARVWRSLRDDGVTKEARQWLWMGIHDGYMIGSKWLRPNMSEELQQRAICLPCQQTETMEHILFTCTACGRELIWSLLRELWQAAGGPLCTPSWGSIFGAPCVELRTGEGVRSHVLERRWTVLAVESARLIWKLRCERVIARDGRSFEDREVSNRWYAELERRLALERRVVALLTGKRKARRAARVDAIWRPLVKSSSDLPLSWVNDSGVLVGIKRGR